MATKDPAASPALRAILRNFAKVNRKCSPELLKAMHITLDWQADPKADEDELPEFFRSPKASEIFNTLERASLFVLREPQVKPGTQDLVAWKMSSILRHTLDLRVNYHGRIDNISLFMGRRNYSLPKLGPSSLGEEYTCDKVRICTVYLEHLPGETEAIHAREMFCLLATAQNARRRNKIKSRKSYMVGKILLQPQPKTHH